MNTGISLFEIAHLVNLAYKTYQDAKRACGEHDEMTREVNGLHTVLAQIQAESVRPNSILNRPHDPQCNQLADHCRNCEIVLGEIDGILVKYNGMGKEKRSWKKLLQVMRFSTGDMQRLWDVRSKLEAHKSNIMICLEVFNIASNGRLEVGMGDVRSQLNWISLQGSNQSLQLAQHTQLGEDIKRMLTEFILAKSQEEEGSVWTDHGNDDREFYRELRRDLVKRGYPDAYLRKKGMMEKIKAFVEDVGRDLDRIDEEDEEKSSCGIPSNSGSTPKKELAEPDPASAVVPSEQIRANHSHSDSAVQFNTPCFNISAPENNSQQKPFPHYQSSPASQFTMPNALRPSQVQHNSQQMNQQRNEIRDQSHLPIPQTRPQLPVHAQESQAQPSGQTNLYIGMPYTGNGGAGRSLYNKDYTAAGATNSTPQCLPPLPLIPQQPRPLVPPSNYNAARSPQINTNNGSGPFLHQNSRQNFNNQPTAPVPAPFPWQAQSANRHQQNNFVPQRVNDFGNTNTNPSAYNNQLTTSNGSAPITWGGFPNQVHNHHTRNNFVPQNVNSSGNTTANPSAPKNYMPQGPGVPNTSYPLCNARNVPNNTFPMIPNLLNNGGTRPIPPNLQMQPGNTTPQNSNVASSQQSRPALQTIPAFFSQPAVATNFNNAHSLGQTYHGIAIPHQRSHSTGSVNTAVPNAFQQPNSAPGNWQNLPILMPAPQPINPYSAQLAQSYTNPLMQHSQLGANTNPPEQPRAQSTEGIIYLTHGLLDSNQGVANSYKISKRHGKLRISKEKDQYSDSDVSLDLESKWFRKPRRRDRLWDMFRGTSTVASMRNSSDSSISSISS